MTMEKKDIFKDHVQKVDVLIVDKNGSSRNRLLKIMYDLGCQRHLIHPVGTVAEAQEVMRTKKVGIVLSDYHVGGGSGFDLFKMIRANDPDNKELTLILVTSNISQTAVAKAAEEDVDSFIIKPYTIQSIQENIVATVAAKIKPSDYIVRVNEGKALIIAGKYEEAIEHLKTAMPLHSKPALALYYIGQAQYLQNLKKNAEGSYSNGLSFNNIHYKCLIGLYDMFIKEERWTDAYQVVKKIAKFFPANPDRLAEIIRLAIRTENFEDMQMYYEIFTSLEERTSGLVNYVGAGLFVSGKHFLRQQRTDEAMAYFDNIAVSCSEFTKFPRAMITTLVEFQQVDAAELYLSRFPAGSDESEDFLVSDFLVLGARMGHNGVVVKRGMELYNKNIRDYQLLKTLIVAMEKCQLKEALIQQVRQELVRLWPERAELKAA
jgi:CheY-like chemotaxis protein